MSHRKALATAPRVDRLGVSLSATVDASKIDRTGGKYVAGFIPGVSLCSRGEALGHGMWIDDEFLQSIESAAATNAKRLKSRFTHPDWCHDGMGKALGTIDNVKKSGDQVFGDLHFYQTSHNAPDGDLADYVMNLADEDPTNFGLSIVFSHDWVAEDEFWDENVKTVEGKDEDGNVVSKSSRFVSPDPLNVQNLPHCRLADLHAADAVDDPAANPGGLFHRQNALLSDGSKLLDFVLGRSVEAPALSSLGVDIAPERLKTFVARHLAKAGISLTEDDSMAKGKAALAEKEKDKEDDKAPDEKKPDDKAPEEKKTDPDAEEDPDDSADDGGDENSKSKCDDETSKGDLAKFCEVFGHADGAKYFLAGTSFEAAQTKHIASLTAQLKDVNDKLAAFAKAGVQPAGFTSAKDKQRDESNAAAGGGTGSGELSGRDKIAAALADKKE